MLKTKKIIINGTVQGVGFRPFIYNLAHNIGLKGYVLNSSDGVVIEITADEKKISNFIDNIKLKKPPQSEITSIEIIDEDYKEFKDFNILKSSDNLVVKTTIPADLAICCDCIKDILDIDNRRYLYPFTNCTNCGPRFSIIEKIPYDRKYTTMKSFSMCEKCLSEYRNPLDRRFHAQPNACPLCGPHLWIKKYDGKIIKKDCIKYISKRIINGNIVFIKGLGGFHIACDAFNKKAVLNLRELKKRDFKPFAVMLGDIKDVLNYFNISKEEENLLNSPNSPILMLRKKEFNLFEYVAPMIDTVGVMIAYTPVHKIIFNEIKKIGFVNPLVMTSGNFKDEPIVKDNNEAQKKFKGYDILLHNRDVKNRVDDSVMFVDDFEKSRLIRRARGFVPQSVMINSNYDKNIFAAGADIKNVFGFYRKGEAILSQHIGDLEIKKNRDFFLNSYFNMKKLFAMDFYAACVDMHPNYYSSSMAKQLGIKNIIGIQHHIAHVYSVMAENNISDGVVGVAFDGTGYGMDGNIWGGEFFVIKNGEIKRVAHFEYMPLPGGDKVVKDIWRSFLSFFRKRKDFIEKVLNKKINSNNIELIYKMIDKKINSPLSSSVGRIFDAVSVVVTGDFVSDFEASGPMKMEHMAYKDIKTCYKFNIKRKSDYYIIGSDSLVDDLIDDWNNKRVVLISSKFHNAVVELIKEMCIKLCKEYDINRICVSGGVFQNRFILNSLIKSFSNFKYNLFLNSKVPSNDGGISLGQIYYTILNKL